MPDQTETFTAHNVGALIDMMAAPLASSASRRRYIHVPGGVRLMIIDSRSLTRECLVAAISNADGIASIDAVPDVALSVARICDHAAPDAILVNFSADPLSDDRLSA